jgi:hypothetical protein
MLKCVPIGFGIRPTRSDFIYQARFPVKTEIHGPLPCSLTRMNLHQQVGVIQRKSLPCILGIDAVSSHHHTTRTAAVAPGSKEF